MNRKSAPPLRLPAAIVLVLACSAAPAQPGAGNDDGDPLSPAAIRRARQGAATAAPAAASPDPAARTGDLAADPRVIYRTQAFEEEPWRSNVLAHRTLRDWVDDPVKGRALRITWKQGENGALNWYYPFWPEAVEAIFQYDILFEEDWRPADGGKLAGWSSATKPDDRPWRLWKEYPKGTEGTLLAGNGGEKVHGDDGWSLRGSFRQPIPASRPQGGWTWLGTYAYHADMPGDYGDLWWWNQFGQGPLSPGRWHTIKQRLRVNTPGKRDGVLEVWVDGLPAFRKTDVYLRGPGPYRLAAPPYNVDTVLAIRRVWLNLYHGGTTPIPADMHVRLANFVVVRVE